MKYLKTDLVIVSIGIVFFVAFNLWNFSLFHQQTLEYLDFCYQQTSEVNLPMTVCSQINLQLDRVRLSAQVENTALMMLLGASLIATLFRMNRLESRIKGLENEENV